MFGDATGLGNGVSATRAPILQEARDAPAGPHSATQPEFTQQARNSQNGQEVPSSLPFFLPSFLSPNPS